MLTLDFTFFWVLLSFVIFTMLMKQFFFDPIAQIRAQRESALTKLQEETRQLEADYQSLEEGVQSALNDARKKARLSIEEAGAVAKKEAATLVQTSRNEADSDREKALSHLSQQAEQTEAVLLESVDELSHLLVHKVKHSDVRLVAH